MSKIVEAAQELEQIETSLLALRRIKQEFPGLYSDFLLTLDAEIRLTIEGAENDSDLPREYIESPPFPMKQWEAAEQVMTGRGDDPLHIDKIIEQGLEMGFMVGNAQTIKRSLATTMARKPEVFESRGNGTWVLISEIPVSDVW